MSDTPKISRPELPKRFYTDVSVSSVEPSAPVGQSSPGEPSSLGEGAFTVLLDGRTLRTPLRRPLIVPAQRLAEILAAEWAAQGERIDPATMPMTRLASTVIDGVADDTVGVRADLAGYVETDMLYYRAGYPDRLVESQRTHWDPVVAYAESRLGARFLLAEGVMHVAQPPTSIAAFRAWIDAVEHPFAVAALHQMTTLTGSALLPYAFAEGHLDLDATWAAAHVDEDWNIGLWGTDAEAEARRANRFADMRTAAEVLAALKVVRSS